MEDNKKELEPKDKEEKTKEKEDKPKKKTAEDVEKEMQQMLDDLSQQMGVDKNQIRVISIKAPKRNFLTILIESLYYIISTALLFIGLSGYISWCEGKWYDLLFYSLMFSAIELVLRNVFLVIFKKTFIQTFGLVMVVPPLIALFVCIFIPFIVTPISIGRYLIVCAILLIVREFIKKYSVDFYYRHKKVKNKK